MEFNMKIRTILIITTVAFMVVAMTLFGVFVSSQLSSTAASVYDEMIYNVASSQSVNVDSYLSTLTSQTKVIAGNSAVTAYTGGSYKAGTDQYDDMLSLITAYTTGTDISYIDVVNSDGTISISTVAELIGTQTDTSVHSQLQDYSVYINSTIIAGSTSRSDYDIIVKATLGDKMLRVCFTNERLTNLISRSNFPTNGRIIVMDARQELVDTTYIGNLQNVSEQSPYAPLRDYVNNTGISGIPKIDYNNGSNLCTARAAVTTGGWTIFATAEQRMAYTYSDMASSSVAGAAVAVVVIFIIAYVIAIVIITKPLYQIEETLLKIRRGDHEARIDIMSKNEYGEIARAFNDMVDDVIVSEGRYRTIIEMSDNIIFEWNMQNNEVIFSNNFNKKFSYRAPSDHFGDSFLLKCKVHPDDADRYREDLEKLAKFENFKHNEYRWKNIYGDYIWVLIRTATIKNKQDEVVKIVGVIVDIDRAKKSENLLTARASFDSLTGVYNRETIENAINSEIELIAVRKNQFAILFVDIDDFKIFNDQYSHATGDQVLRFAANTVKNAVNEFGIVGRYGGDEFIVCVRNSDVNDPTAIAQQILTTLKEGFESDSGDRLSVNVSIGIAIIKENTKRVEEIIGMADDAMYKIKKSGKSNYGFLDDNV